MIWIESGGTEIIKRTRFRKQPKLVEGCDEEPVEENGSDAEHHDAIDQ